MASTSLTYICPVFNNLPGLRLTIASFLPLLEAKLLRLVVSDGFSSDGTFDYVSSISCSSLSIISRPDRSLYEAINNALVDISDGYICVIGSGDTIDSAAVSQHLIPLLSEASQPNLTCICTSILRGIDTSSGLKFKHVPAMHHLYLRPLVMPFNHTGLYLHKSIYSQIGLYDCSYRICSDHDFCIRLLDVPELNFILLNQPLVSMAPAGLSQSRKHRFKYLSELFQILFNHYKFSWPLLIVLYLLLLMFSFFRSIFVVY
jgi:glycosyltransferase involved in cell wall biosynthesis